MDTDPSAVDFSVAVTMRGPAAHLEVRGTVDDEATRTLESLLERLPAADVTEVVVDLTGATADAATKDELSDAVVAAAPNALGVTIAEDG